jgi:hypothetical protein
MYKCEQIFSEIKFRKKSKAFFKLSGTFANVCNTCGLQTLGVEQVLHRRGSAVFYVFITYFPEVYFTMHAYMLRY